jgi:hypothetical protein
MSDIHELFGVTYEALEQATYDSFLPSGHALDEARVRDMRTRRAQARVCLTVAPRACQFLKRQGVPVVTEYHVVHRDDGAWGHMFVSGIEAGQQSLLPEDFVIDPTYRQFLDPSSTEDLPNIFVGPRAVVMDLVETGMFADRQLGALYTTESWVPGRSQ